VRSNRAISTTSLAFIDVMSCGLGAVILLLILLDFNRPSDDIVTPEPVAVVNEEEANKKLLKRKQKLIRASGQENNKIEKLVAAVSDAMIDYSQKAIKLTEIPRTPDPKPPKENLLDKPASGELIGMSVKGKRILIALDTSASMSNEKLIDIIMGLSDTSGRRLASGKKWLQAKRTLLWTIKNAPKNSQIQVLGYSDEVKPLTSGWMSQKDTLNKVGLTLKTLSPIGGTSLGQVLEYVEEKSLAANSLYIITDGLPTIAGQKNSGLTKFKECFKFGSNKNAYIEGGCREALFAGAVNRFQKTSTSTVNIILLPLEGDPKAAPLYWKWANMTRGILFAPARGWPPS